MPFSVTWHTLLDELKACIGKLTEFKSGASFHTRAGGEL
jgi:hypothetical protein